MKKFILLIMLAVSHCAYSQEINSEKDLNAFMEGLPPEQKDSLEKDLRLQQVHNIGGIPFGISREEALSRLRNKYGEPEYNQSSRVMFKNIKYAGRDFSAVLFLFESDGINSYLNSCIFVNDAKTKSEAIKKWRI